MGSQTNRVGGKTDGCVSTTSTYYRAYEKKGECAKRDNATVGSAHPMIACLNVVLRP
jgi:hypothetical protein